MVEYKDIFTVFIISYNRADRVYTYNTLKRQGYTGDIYIIIDKSDPQKEEYRKRYEDKVIIFDKNDYLWVDLLDNNINDKQTPVYARNAVYDIAENLGYKYFLVLDDDYRGFEFPGMRFIKKKRAKDCKIDNLDDVFKIVLDFYINTPFKVIAFAQSGDFIWGKGRYIHVTRENEIKFNRKVMNSHFCSVDRRIEWKGRMNDDVNTYVYWGNKGYLFLTIYFISLYQQVTQTNPGGLTETYKRYNTYKKSFMSLMCCPSSIKISSISQIYIRPHHKIFWEYTVPAIIPEKYKKCQDHQK